MELSVTSPKIESGSPEMANRNCDDRAPNEPHLTGYDEAHLSDYLRLLDADEEGADWREAVSIIFGINPASEPERARTVHSSHLARARWMTRSGVCLPLGPRAS